MILLTRCSSSSFRILVSRLFVMTFNWLTGAGICIVGSERQAFAGSGMMIERRRAETSANPRGNAANPIKNRVKAKTLTRFVLNIPLRYGVI